MSPQEQAYINGFVKRAAAYGLSSSEALYLLKEAEKPGLWANIRAKRARGEKAAKPGDKDYPDKKQWSKLTKESASSPAWQRSEGKNPEGGLNAKGRASYKRETGGTLKAPVTESEPKGERAKRQNSFCSRMCGMKRVNTGSKAQSDPDSRINKSLRKWNCKCGEAHDALIDKLACIIKEGRCWEGYEPVPGKESYSEDSCRPKRKVEKAERTPLHKSAYSYSDEMGEMNRWLDGGAPWSNKLHKDFYKDPKGVAALTKHFTDIVRSQGADVKFLSDSYYDDKTVKMSPEDAIAKLLAQKELKFNADDAPNYYQIMYPFEQVGKFKWKNNEHPSQLSINEYLKALNLQEKSAANKMRVARPAMVKTQPKMLAPIKASPQRPYAETRATLDDLSSFPISEDDFLKGGGRIMFQDPAKTNMTPPVPAAPVPVAP